MALISSTSSTLTKIPACAATNKLAMNMILAKPAASTPKVFFHANSPRPCSFQLASRRSYGVMATSYDEAAKQGRDVAKKGADAAVRGGQQLKKGATSAADNASEAMVVTGNASVNAKLEAAGKMKQSAQDAAGKVMKTAEGAWGSVKDATQQIKDKVVGKAEAGAETVKKEAARSVDRAMNTKNREN